MTTFTPHSQKQPKKLFLYDVSASPGSNTNRELCAPGECTYSQPAGELVVRCGDGSELLVRTVKPQGRQAIPAGAWWNGVKSAVIALGSKESSLKLLEQR